MAKPNTPPPSTYVVVVFGDKRKHSDVLGMYTYAEAEAMVAMLEERDGFECHAFPVQSEGQYTRWLTGGAS